jgi:hypothetical protein
MNKARILFLLPLALALVCGCNRGNPHSRSSVSGKVTYNNQPVTGGTVTFIPKEGPVYMRPIEASGTYTATEIPAGDYTVTIETESANKAHKQPQYGGNRGAKMTMSPAPEGAPAGAGEYVKIPAKYGDKAKTPLKDVNVIDGRNTKDFELTD